MNTDEPAFVWPLFSAAERRVLEIQTKLHRWATGDSHHRFGDLFNLVADPSFLMVAWDRVRSNKGARTAGVDGATATYIETALGVEEFLDRLRQQLKQRSFQPVPVKERMIPKANGKLRRLGIPTTADRVVQASLKLVLEPIFEADFYPCSYGFRPGRRAQDAIAETHFLASRSYEWVVEGDITACFDEISHPALMDRVRARIADKRILGLVKAFLKAGILDQKLHFRASNSGTPQGGILSPLLANIALSILDEYFSKIAGGSATASRERERRRRQGKANYHLVRYADDFLILVAGGREHAEEVFKLTEAVLAPMGLRLSPEKTMITHINDGLDFLGWHIQRHRKRGTDRHYVYTYPAKKAVKAIKAKIKVACRQGYNEPLATLLKRLNAILRGWTAYFRPGVSSSAFSYLASYTWARVMRWIRTKHRKITWKELRRRYCGSGWWPVDGTTALFDPGKVRTTRYKYRATRIPTPWTVTC